MVDNLTLAPLNDSDDHSGLCHDKLLRQKNNENSLHLLPVIIFIACLMITGFVGNLIVFYVYRMKNKVTTKGVFISNLAILDLLICCFTMPFEIVDIKLQYIFENDILCKFSRFVETSLVLSAGFTLVAVSIDRYMNLCYRKSKFLFTTSRAKRICIFCVGLSVCNAWPIIIFAGLGKVIVDVSGIRIKGTECKMFGDGKRYGMDVNIYIYLLYAVFSICIVIMIVLYVLIAMKLYQRRRGSIHNGILYLQNSIESAKLHHLPADFEKCGYAIGKRGVKMKGSTVIFYSVTIVFILGFLPHLTVRVLNQTGEYFTGSNLDLLYNFMVRSYLINSACNPFIYSLLHQRFRQDVNDCFKQLLRYSKCWRNKSIST